MKRKFKVTFDGAGGYEGDAIIELDQFSHACRRAIVEAIPKVPTVPKEPHVLLSLTSLGITCGLPNL